MTQFEEFRTRLKNSWQRLVIIDADSEGKQVEIRSTEVASHRRLSTAIYCYAASLACRCHWSEAAAWCHGFRYGSGHRPSHPPESALDENADVISKLEELNLYLYFDRDSKEPTRFHIVSYEGHVPRWEDGTALDSFPPDNKIPTYQTTGEVERWLEGRLYGIAEQKKDK
jgi:hypothetical protein